MNRFFVFLSCSLILLWGAGYPNNGVRPNGPLNEIPADDSLKEIREKIRQRAKEHYDAKTPYSQDWKKRTTTHRDCSSMAQDLYDKAGIKYPIGCGSLNQSAAMFNAIEKKIPATPEGLKALKVGDTLYFTRENGIGHVATVVENPSAYCNGGPLYFHTNSSKYDPNYKCLSLADKTYVGAISLEEVVAADGKAQSTSCERVYDRVTGNVPPTTDIPVTPPTPSEYDIKDNTYFGNCDDTVFTPESQNCGFSASSQRQVGGNPFEYGTENKNDCYCATDLSQEEGQMGVVNADIIPSEAKLNEETTQMIIDSINTLVYLREYWTRGLGVEAYAIGPQNTFQVNNNMDQRVLSDTLEKKNKEKCIFLDAKINELSAKINRLEHDINQISRK